MEPTPQDLLNAVVAQREALANDLARFKAHLDAKDRRIAELEKQLGEKSEPSVPSNVVPLTAAE
jgi:hypothetical protein